MRHRSLLLSLLLSGCGPSTVSTSSSTAGGSGTDSLSPTQSGSTSSEGESDVGSSGVGPGDSATSVGSTASDGSETDDTTGGAETSDREATSTGFVSTCGDAVVDAGEVCDDGNEADGDNCAADCSHTGVARQVVDESVREYRNVALTTDDAVFVVSAGESKSAIAAAPLRLHKFDTDGQELWSVIVREYVGGHTDLVSDGQGNAVVMASGVGLDGGDLIAKYDANGDLVWTISQQDSYGRYLAATTNHVYLLTQVFGTVVVHRWSSEGGYLGRSRIVGDAERYVLPSGLAATESGVVSVVGGYHPVGAMSGFVALTDWNVELEPPYYFEIEEYELEAALSEVVELSPGTLAVANLGDWARCYEGLAPAPCWLESAPPGLWRMAAGSSGHVAGISVEDDQDQISSYDADGNRIARVDLNFVGFLADLGVDSTGAVWGVGRIDEPGVSHGVLFKTAWGDSE